MRRIEVVRLKATSLNGRILGGDGERSVWGGQGPMHVYHILLLKICLFNASIMFCYFANELLAFKQGAKQIYRNHIRPFLLKHQGSVDRVLGLAYCEVLNLKPMQIKLVSSYQKEIKSVKTIVGKITESADKMLRSPPTASDRSSQHSSVDESTTPPSDAEPGQNDS
ncbi:HVA22-like protein k [Trifolium pratense]|uniref:HVA22-like protein k n=2 Tax=Trifolium pratense TaxID=57577 RepID=A0A2K3PM69_TRIPR|nr:HVA22-like protein k [Trifolium pratense]